LHSESIILGYEEEGKIPLHNNPRSSGEIYWLSKYYTIYINYIFLNT
jgi:hypothetical protein